MCNYDSYVFYPDATVWTSVLKYKLIFRIRSLLLGLRLLHVVTDHPVDPELICKHPKIITPEGIGHWHSDFPSLGEFIEQEVRFFLVIGIDRDGQIISLYIPRWPFPAGIAAH